MELEIDRWVRQVVRFVMLGLAAMGTMVFVARIDGAEVAPPPPSVVPAPPVDGMSPVADARAGAVPGAIASGQPSPTAPVAGSSPAPAVPVVGSDRSPATPVAGDAGVAVAAGPACAKRPQPAAGRLRIGTRTRSSARACRPYDLQYHRTVTTNPDLPDVWWSPGVDAGPVNVVLDEPFVARLITLDVYGYHASCAGALDVSIEGGPSRAVPLAPACAEANAAHSSRQTLTLELDAPTPITSLRIAHRIAPEQAGVVLEGIELRATRDRGPRVAELRSIWAEVHEPPRDTPTMGLWLVKPGQRPRKLSPLTSDTGSEVRIWDARRSSRALLAPNPEPRVLYTMDTARDAQPRRLASFDHEIRDAYYDECLDAFTVSFEGRAPIVVSGAGEIIDDPCR